MGDTKFYTFGEVIKALGVTSNKVNKLIETGELTPTRHMGYLKFRSSDVAKIKQKGKVKQRYSWGQVLRTLQLEDDELQNLVNMGKLKAHREEGRLTFDKKEIDKRKFLLQNEKTKRNRRTDLSYSWEEVLI